MNAEKRTITPSEAKELLKGNNRNRPIKKHHVKRLAEDMSAGKWAFNGIPIVFNGRLLIDGQHRLMACVASGRPFDTLVVNGVDADAFVTIDTGVKRSGADTLATKGEKNATILSAALVLVDLYYSSEIGIRMTTQKGTNRTVAEALKKYVAIRPCVDHCVSMSTKILPVSIMSACHYIFSRIDSVKADDFIDRLATGNNVKADSAMSSLRDRLIDNYTSVRKHSRGYIMSLVIQAWNYERSGRKVTRLRGFTGESNEKFPTAI